MKALSAVLRFAAAVAELLLLKRRAQPVEERRKAREAVAAGDADAVNAALEEARLRRKKGSCLVELLFALALVAVACAFGCVRTRVIAIDGARTVERMEKADGRTPGWFVPDATMADMVEATVRLGQEERN